MILSCACRLTAPSGDNEPVGWFISWFSLCHFWQSPPGWRGLAYAIKNA